MAKLLISVVVCTHNPRARILERVLNGLKCQTLSLHEWECVVIDNHSVERVREIVDLSWHPQGRVVREDALGLTNARIRGFKETTGSLIVLVDDDNLLQCDYLLEAVQVASTHERLGAFGGSIVGEFEKEPPGWFSNFEFDLLGVRPISKDFWSNFAWLWESMPIGAGMVIRREIADAYAVAARSDALRSSLDRKGSDLVSGGDTDITITACEMGYGVGRFAALVVHHLISADRVELDYLCKLAEGIGFSQAVLERSKGTHAASTGSWRYQLLRTGLEKYRLVRMRSAARSVQTAFRKGKLRGQRIPLSDDIGRESR